MIQQVRLIDTIEAPPDSWRVKGGYPESRLVSVGRGWSVGQKTFSDDAENSSWRLDRLETRRWGNPKSLRGSL
jgi:hypothetical protein